jgi:hypothetical protein
MDGGKPHDTCDTDYLAGLYSGVSHPYRGRGFRQTPDTLRRIVKFRGLDLTTPGGSATARSVVAGSMSNEVHQLWLINAMAIRLPTSSATQALVSLQKNPNVEEVFDDLLNMADGAICIDPAPPPLPRATPGDCR